VTCITRKLKSYPFFAPAIVVRLDDFYLDPKLEPFITRGDWAVAVLQ